MEFKNLAQVNKRDKLSFKLSEVYLIVKPMFFPKHYTLQSWTHKTALDNVPFTAVMALFPVIAPLRFWSHKDKALNPKKKAITGMWEFKNLIHHM